MLNLVSKKKLTLSLRLQRGEGPLNIFKPKRQILFNLNNFSSTQLGFRQMNQHNEPILI